MLKKILAVASTVVLFATGAQAVTFSLYNGADLNGVGSKTAGFDKGGVSGSVTADSTFLHGALARVSATPYGIGVKNIYTPDNPAVDGFVAKDSLTFTFDKAVKLISVVMTPFTRSTDWDIYVDGVKFANENNDRPFFFGGIVGTSFKVMADGWKDKFVVSSFTVAPIPLPASALLLIGGLAGFGVMRRRKQRLA